MEFDIFVKDKDIYKKMLISVPSGADWNFFKHIKLTLDQQLDNIRNDIVSIFNLPKEKINLISPVIDDSKKQLKIDALVKMRTVNTKLKESITEYLSDSEFIICKNCEHKMYKTPVNVSYNKIGNKFILNNINPHQIIKYVFMCENCPFAISEEIYNKNQSLIKLRNQLIADGECFVPNEYNFWHWIDGNKRTKPSFLIDEELKSRKRTFEIIKIEGVKQPFVKIIDTYI